MSKGFFKKKKKKNLHSDTELTVFWTEVTVLELQRSHPLDANLGCVSQPQASSIPTLYSVLLHLPSFPKVLPTCPFGAPHLLGGDLGIKHVMRKTVSTKYACLGPTPTLPLASLSQREIIT